MLFAEIDETTIWVSALTGIIGAAGTFLASQFWKVRETRRRELKEDERDILSRQDALIERMSIQMREFQAKIDRLSDKFTQAVAHLRYLEGLLEDKGIKFRPFPESLMSLGSGEVHTQDSGGP